MEIIESLSVNGINILVLVFGIVEFSKKLKLSGAGLTIFSMVLGVAFGVLGEVAKMYPAIAEWYGVAVIGLSYGVAACGIYDFAKKFVKTPAG